LGKIEKRLGGPSFGWGRGCVLLGGGFCGFMSIFYWKNGIAKKARLEVKVKKGGGARAKEIN